MERIVDSEQKTQDFTINLSIFVSDFEQTGQLAKLIAGYMLVIERVYKPYRLLLFKSNSPMSQYNTKEGSTLPKTRTIASMHKGTIVCTSMYV
jgi:hypothetical protein